MKSIKSNGCIPVLDKQAMTREIESIVDSPEILKGGYKVEESYRTVLEIYRLHLLYLIRLMILKTNFRYLS